MNLTPLDEQRLVELKHIVAERSIAGSPARRPDRAVRVLRPVLGLAAAASAAAIALVATSGGGTPAFAVTKNAGGVVTIKITDYSDTAQLTAELKSLGLPASVVYVPAGKTCYQAQAWVALNDVKGVYSAWSGIPGGVELTFNPELLRPGQSIIFGLGQAVVNRLQVDAVSTFVVTGHLTACQFFPLPPLVIPISPASKKTHAHIVQGASIRFPNDPVPAGK
jgi:hypothetical protein